MEKSAQSLNVLSKIISKLGKGASRYGELLTGGNKKITGHYHKWQKRMLPLSLIPTPFMPGSIYVQLDALANALKGTGKRFPKNIMMAPMPGDKNSRNIGRAGEFLATTRLAKELRKSLGAQVATAAGIGTAGIGLAGSTKKEASISNNITKENNMTEAYMNGFSKTASDYGVDPEELLKVAQLGALRGAFNAFKGIKGMSNVGRGLAQVSKGLGGTALNAGRMAQGVGQVGLGLGRMGAGLIRGGFRVAKPIAKGLGRAGREFGKGLAQGAAEFGREGMNLGREGLRAAQPAAREIGRGLATGATAFGKGMGAAARGLGRLGQAGLRAAQPAVRRGINAIKNTPVNSPLGIAGSAAAGASVPVGIHALLSKGK